MKIHQALSEYSIKQAANRLAVTLGDEKIGPEEVLRLIIQGDIPLYWHINFAVSGLKVPANDGSKSPEDLLQELRANLPAAKPLGGLYRISLETNSFIKSRLISMMYSQERNEIEASSNVIVEDEEGGQWYVLGIGKISEKEAENPIEIGDARLFIHTEPEYSALVVRRADLEIFEQKLDEKSPQTKSGQTKERKTLLRLVTGMAKDRYDYDPKDAKSPTPKKISDNLIEYGISISDDTIRKYLKWGAEFIDQKKPD